MSEMKPTPGPWHADKHGRIWRRPPSDLYENGGGVAGDKPLATVNKGWFGEGEEGYPVDANARLIAEAGTVHHETGLTPRQLVERVKEMEEALRCYMDAIHYAQDKKALMAAIKDADNKARAALSKSLPNTVAETPT